MTEHDPYSGRQQREDRRSTRPARSSSGCCTCRPPTRCGRRPTRCSRCRTTSSRRRARTCQINPALRVGPRLLQPEHRHHLGRRSPVRVSGQRRRRPGAGRGNESQDPNSTHTVPAGEPGRHLGRGDRPAADDAPPARPERRLPVRRPRDHPGGPARVAALAATAELAAGYQQINSSVGQFGTDTLIADTKALASGSSSDDSAYQTEQQTLLKLANDRDRVVTKIKKALNGAAHNQGLHHGQVQALSLAREQPSAAS